MNCKCDDSSNTFGCEQCGPIWFDGFDAGQALAKADDSEPILKCKRCGIQEDLLSNDYCKRCDDIQFGKKNDYWPAFGVNAIDCNTPRLTYIADGGVIGKGQSYEDDCGCKSILCNCIGS